MAQAFLEKHVIHCQQYLCTLNNIIINCIVLLYIENYGLLLKNITEKTGVKEKPRSSVERFCELLQNLEPVGNCKFYVLYFLFSENNDKSSLKDDSPNHSPKVRLHALLQTFQKHLFSAPEKHLLHQVQVQPIKLFCAMNFKCVQPVPKFVLGT